MVDSVNTGIASVFTNQKLLEAVRISLMISYYMILIIGHRMGSIWLPTGRHGVYYLRFLDSSPFPPKRALVASSHSSFAFQQAKQLEENTKKMTKQAQQWVKLLEEFNTSLKELGDVENWAKKMEHDMRDISTALAFVHASGAAKGR